jgi:competence protein ComEC
MSSLSITLIDVGWGDSILIESVDANNNSFYALIDSNDTKYLRSSYIFLKKFFEKKGYDVQTHKPFFEFVMLSHPHADHGQGLKAIMREFGTRKFWYPKSSNWGSLASLLQFSNQSGQVAHHQSVDNTKVLPQLGEVNMEIWWPLYNQIDPSNENNNSIVLSLTLNNVSFILTGDAEGEVWDQISQKINNNVFFFKVPHHGSVNGTFNQAHHTPWLDRCSLATRLAISSHVRPFHHPHPEVINLFNNRAVDYYRTDENYHITCWTDGAQVQVKYSHT